MTQVPLTDLTSELAVSTTPKFIQDNLISDGSVPAQATDPNLVNPWGVSFSPTSPFWISDNGTGLASVDSVQNGAVTLNVRPPVTIPSPPDDTSAPTGQVFNSFPNAFMLSDGQPATFLFATEDGTIAGWNPAAGNTALLPVDNSTNSAEGDSTLDVGAVYKGLAVGMSNWGRHCTRPISATARWTCSTRTSIRSAAWPIPMFRAALHPSTYKC